MLSVARRDAGGAALFSLLLLFAGCSSQPIKTQPVSGNVQIKDGDAAILTGSTIELQSESDETLRPYGNIDSSGKFTVKTLYQGKLLAGAPEGKYKARLILADQGDEGVPKRKGNEVHRRFFEFGKSGLSISVPSADYTVVLSRQ
jgi:hypothetical protein